MEYIVQSSYLKPSKNKFPDIVYWYISNESQLPVFYSITRDKEDAYVFDESELEDARFIADAWRMDVKEIK